MADPHELYKGRIVRLTLERATLPNQRVVQLELVRHPGAAAVVPLRDDGQVVLIHQFRYAVGGYLYEVPAGTLSPGETPEQCARREVEEEAGYRLGRLEPLGRIVTAPGFCDEQIHLFLATELQPTRQALERDEVLSVTPMPFDAAMAKIRDNTIRDAKSIAALHLAYERAKTLGLIS